MRLISADETNKILLQFVDGPRGFDNLRRPPPFNPNDHAALTDRSYRRAVHIFGKNPPGDTT
jgi:hypothetical protein